jgi:hypothetical protein
MKVEDLLKKDNSFERGLKSMEENVVRGKRKYRGDGRGDGKRGRRF